MKAKMKSISLIGLIYIIGALLSSLLFLKLNMPIIYALLITDVFYTVYIYIGSLILRNASLYDPYWSVVPPLMLILVAIYLGQPLSMGVMFMLFGISFWAVRLTYNWAKHWTDFNHMDWRYQNFKDQHPRWYWLINLFGIHLVPTAVVFLQLILGVYIIMANPVLNLWIVVATLLMIFAAIVQYIADLQMDQFKDKHKGTKACIDEGLWRYSRHPNYLGEITVWWALYIIYASIDGFNLWIISPIMMTALFWFISIPMMEKKILKTRPEYEDYQKHVSKLFFFFRRDKEEMIEEMD